MARSSDVSKVVMPRVLASIVLALLLLGGALSVPVRADGARDAIEGLKKALRRGDADERIRAVRNVGGLAGTFTEAQRRSASVRIAKSLPAEADPRVRHTMVRTLSRLGGSTGWIPVIVAALGDADDTVRNAARQAVLWGGGDYLDVVSRLIEEDKDPSFRADVILLLGDRRRADAVPLLLRVLAKEHPRVQSAAAEALEAITEQAFGYDAVAWSAWWEREGKAALTGPTSTDPAAETVTVAPPWEREVPEPTPHVPRALWPSFYGLRLQAKDIVFVVDISGSVGSSGVVRAKKELVQAVERLGSDVHIAALFFDEQVRMWKPEMVRATPKNKAELALFLRAIQPGRRTDVFTPLNAGLQIVRRRVAQKKEAGETFREAVTMIVVSDGVDTAAQTPAHIVEEKLSRLDPARTVVHAVVLGGKGSALMAELARRGGGHYVVVR